VDEQIKEAVVRQAMEFWIEPEIERRRAAGTVREDFALAAAQVIFDPEADEIEVRLNDEVKAAVLVEAKRDVAKGEEITADEIAAYKDIILTEDDPNAGHITIVPHQEHWGLAFDFRRNAAHIGAHVDRARQFLDTAAWARQEGKVGPFVDNLFSATELMAKGLLIWMPDEKLLRAKSHGLIHDRFNYERKMDNVDPRFAKLLNDLAGLRRPARYLARNFSLSDDEMDEMLAVAEEMHAALEASRPVRAVRPSSVRPDD
jgi:HEPN domain-containing protein